MIDFTNCKKYNKTYGGANGNKICISYNNKKYMLKFPSTPTKKTELSYANGCISEFISCHIYNMLGVDAQNTILGIYNTGKKEKIVVACEDFTDIGVVIQDFGSLKNQFIDSIHNGYGTELDDILEAIEQQNQIDQFTLLTRFWDMFVIDALLGNFDRHNGNWGFLYNQMTDSISLAPVYDCGSCLLPQADKQTVATILSSEKEINNRIYNYPNSAIKINDKKLNYYSFLTTTDDPNCLESIVKIENRFNYKEIENFIDTIECLDNQQKEFYKRYIFQRHEKIILPSYKRAISMSIQQNQNEDSYDYEDR